MARDWLKKQREVKRLKQDDIASKLGVSRAYYSRIENGERQKDMSVAMAEKLAEALDVPLTVILDNERKGDETDAW